MLTGMQIKTSHWTFNLSGGNAAAAEAPQTLTDRKLLSNIND